MMMLELRNIRKSYDSLTVLDGLSLAIPAGELYGFIGTNGAGKTTTLRIAAGLLRPDSGQVLIDGRDLWEHRDDAAASSETLSRIGYVPDFFGVYENLYVWEYMEFFASCSGLTGLKARQRCEMLLDQTGLYERRDYFVSSLSRGMKQRLCLARALIHDPKLLIMDEPASGLDPVTRSEYMQILRELCGQGKTIFISSHILSELSDICTSAGIIESGKMILSGPLSSLFDSVHLARRIRIVLAGSAECAIGVLKRDPKVSSIAIDGREIRITFTGQEEDAEQLLRDLVESGARVTGFMREKDDLENAFMQLAGRKGRKAVISYEMESDIPEGDRD
jgi:ABC-2 type transport system ATP-binding protein